MHIDIEKPSMTQKKVARRDLARKFFSKGKHSLLASTKSSNTRILEIEQTREKGKKVIYRPRLNS
jgi:hypothetical protein